MSAQTQRTTAGALGLLSACSTCLAADLSAGTPLAVWALVGLSLVVACAGCLLAGMLWARLRADRVVRAQQQLHSQWTEVAPAWTWRTDAQHRLVQWQAPAAAIDPGAAAEAARRRSSPALLADHDWSAPHPALRAALMDGHLFRDLRLTIGSQSWRVDGAPLRDEGGALIGFVGCAQCDDAAAWPMVPRPAAGAPEPDLISSTLSHDLRAPIRVVEGFTRIVKEDYGRLLGRVGNEHLDRVLSAAARMNLMIDALLTFSRLSAQTLARSSVDLSGLADQVVDELRRTTPGREVAVEIEPGLQAEGDPMLLRLVLENLLGNAWKYTARADAARISLRAVMHDGRRTFEVADNGAGFDMRGAERLFGLFQRLHSASDFPGHGVGLASVRRIVRRHGGDVWAQGEPERGARFSFTLP